MLVDRSNSKWLRFYRRVLYFLPFSFPVFIILLTDDLSLVGFETILGALCVIPVVLFFANRVIIQSVYVKGSAYWLSVAIVSAWGVLCLFGVYLSMIVLEDALGGVVFVLSASNAYVQTAAIVYPPRILQMVEEDEELLDEELLK